jgi:hypothetical protein
MQLPNFTSNAKHLRMPLSLVPEQSVQNSYYKALVNNDISFILKQMEVHLKTGEMYEHCACSF